MPPFCSVYYSNAQPTPRPARTACATVTTGQSDEIVEQTNSPGVCCLFNLSVMHPYLPECLGATHQSRAAWLPSPHDFFQAHTKYCTSFPVWQLSLLCRTYRAERGQCTMYNSASPQVRKSSACFITPLYSLCGKHATTAWHFFKSRQLSFILGGPRASLEYYTLLSFFFLSQCHLLPNRLAGSHSVRE